MVLYSSQSLIFRSQGNHQAHFISMRKELQGALVMCSGYVRSFLSFRKYTMKYLAVMMLYIYNIC